MTDTDKNKMVKEADVVSAVPLVFISHDSRDAELAEAFSKLLKSVSAGMIKTFRSSDKKAGDGIDFGEEWYKRLMTQLQTTSDVICLFTERSLERPWILFEAGVAKGKLDTPVIGVALGVPLSRVTVGPFYQFQNMDDGEEDLTKLVHQLARRVSGLELDPDVVKAQIEAFKAAEINIVELLGTDGKHGDDPEESSVAKLMEEIKTIPSRVAERLVDEDPFRRRRMMGRFHPMMFEELMHMSDEPGDPVAILMAASIVRDDMPWLYELAMEVYRAAKTGNTESIERELQRLRRFSKMMMHGPFMEEFGFGRKEYHMIAMEFPRMLEHTLKRTVELRRPTSKKKLKSSMADEESTE